MPDFTLTNAPHDAMMLQDAYDAITACDLWEWLRVYSPPEGQGFMFATHPNLDKITAEMKYGGHSGASYGMTMRVMDLIAKQGWDAYVQSRRPCACRAEKGHTWGWCGVAGGGVPACDH